jgi:hypothetical protein
MEKKESAKKKNESKEAGQPSSSGKGSWISGKFMDIIKLAVGICLLPFVYGSSVAFLKQIVHIDASLQHYFWGGVGAFLLVHLFFFEVGFIYDKGYQLLEIIFNFFQPLVKFAPYLLPVYTILSFVLYFIFSMFVKDKWLLEMFVFFIGATISLHLVFSSRSIRSKKGDLFKSNYIFGFSLVYIINLCLLSIFLNVMIADYSFFKFITTMHVIAGDIFKSIFTQLFVVS